MQTFFGQKPAAKNEKKIFVLNEKKRISFSPAKRSAQNPGFLLLIIGRGESGKAILYVSIAGFLGAVKIYFRQMAQPPRKKWSVRQRMNLNCSNTAIHINMSTVRVRFAFVRIVLNN